MVKGSPMQGTQFRPLAQKDSACLGPLSPFATREATAVRRPGTTPRESGPAHRNQRKPQVATKASVQFSSVTQSCPTLCDPMDCSTPGLPVHHQLPEFTQTHVHRVSDAIQPSHPLSSPSPSAFNLSQHQGLFK